MFRPAISLALCLLSTVSLVGAVDENVMTNTVQRRPTHYSEAPFFDVLLSASRGVATRTRFPTRTWTRTRATSISTSPPTTSRTSAKPTSPSLATRRPTTKPPVVRFKDNAARDDLITCTHSVDNYHVILSPTGILPSVAADACGQFGWQYAVPAQEDWQKVSWVLSNCTFLSAGLHAFAGHYTGGCQFVQQNGYYLMKLGEEECEASGDFPILCADTPVQTITTTASIPVETTTTVLFLPPKAAPRIAKSDVAVKRQQQFGDIINGYDVCITNVNGYHLVYDAVDASSAAQVCSDLGWNLAEVPYGSVDDIVALYNDCQPYDIMFHISSYDGLATGHCKFAYVVPWPSVWMVVANDPVQCGYFYVPVLCQEAPLSVTAQSGTMVLSTVTLVTTESVSYATNTITVTVTAAV